MPGKLKVRVVAGRDLPIMDRASDLTDAFVEVKFGATNYKTDVQKKSLNPQWNSDWFKFEVDDEDLQDEPLQIRVLDHDTYSAHDVIGKVYIDIDPLLTKDSASVMQGWFPIYDTMHGIRGSVYIVVKVDLFIDTNRFRQSSCGVQFFCSPSIPYGMYPVAILGFVEELVVNDDPEYQWIDKIRTPRASNEARQSLFSKLSGELQRKIGLKVLEMGGNAVIGYRQCFDLEGESGIVVRAIGTAAHLARLQPPPVSPHQSPPVIKDAVKEAPVPEEGTAPPPSPTKLFSSPLPKEVVPPIGPAERVRRQSSDSDLSTTPKGGSVGSSGSSGGKATMIQKLMSQQPSLDVMEYPFFTLRSFQPGFLQSLGGVVSARSVKLLDRIHNPDEPETRDAWWIELRQEIRSHAHALGCNAVVGYSESTSICDELIVLSAAGTAALLNLRPEEAIFNKDPSLRQSGLLTCSLDRRDFETLQQAQRDTSAGSGYGPTLLERSFAVRRSLLHGQPGTSDEVSMSCSPCHIPYDRLNTPFPIVLENCAVCRHGKVPDVLFTTIEPPVDLPVTGHGCLIQARVCRGKRKLQGEANAAAVSDVLPFMEYELHRQLMHKLKAKSMNSLFGLNVEISVGETLIIGIATATAAFLSALPVPGPLKITGKNGSEQKVSAMQKRVQDMQAKNRDIYDLQHLSSEPPDVTKEEDEKELPDVADHMPSSPGCHSNHSHSSSGSDLSELDLSAGKKEAFVIEIDDAEDEDIVSLMLDSPEPEGFQSCNTELPPGIQILTSNVQTFTTVMTYNDSQALAHHSRHLTNIFDNILKTLYFKLRMMVPCCLSDVRFHVAIPEDNEMQVTVTAAAVGLQESPPSASETQPHVRRRQRDSKLQESSTEKQDNDRFPESSESDREDMMFVMDGDPESTPQSSTPTKLTPTQHIPGQSHQTHPYTAHTRSVPPNLPLYTAHTRSVSPNSPLHSTYQVSSTKLTPTQHIPGPRTYKQEGRSQLTPHGIQLSPLSYVPGGRVERYLGHVNMFFIRESTSVREHGGMNGVVHKFLLEVQAILRAHVSALGGNALLSHTVSQVVLLDNPNRNQGQCLLNVSGDAACVVYYGDQILPVSVPFSLAAIADRSPIAKFSPKEAKRKVPLMTDL
ncbi:PREDICTED: C2 domain-containing protein 5-like isoform X1 [Branchiostoma belcheri]|uniref:C2 domain-containing protein 5-like isoform X1 n=1 Tax=Branchiostoma belcheri TaxID=7741 RepID=A0A6P4Y5J8_BRABE|nr:PREDICTED: C2 domain-containing protein 5-like isoform X1 [Branchiostoma belcheri]